MNSILRFGACVLLTLDQENSSKRRRHEIAEGNCVCRVTLGVRRRRGSSIQHEAAKKIAIDNERYDERFRLSCYEGITEFRYDGVRARPISDCGAVHCFRCSRLAERDR